MDMTTKDVRLSTPYRVKQRVIVVQVLPAIGFSGNNYVGKTGTVTEAEFSPGPKKMLYTVKIDGDENPDTFYGEQLRPYP